jgi:hypothetical protein
MCSRLFSTKLNQAFGLSVRCGVECLLLRLTFHFALDELRNDLVFRAEQEAL